MQKLFFAIIFCLLFAGNKSHAQDIRFTQVLKNQTGQVTDGVQDKQGFLWIGSFEQGLKRYDGINLKSFQNDPLNPNSIVSGYIIDLYIDKQNTLWIGTLGSGLDKYDQATNTFIHFKHDPKDASSLSNDTVSSILEDHLGNLWVGTVGGLDLLDRKTGKFTHYKSDENDPASLSNNEVYKLFEDRSGVLWIGCFPIARETSPGKGGLNRFDRKTGKFTRYLNDKSDPTSIHDNRITSIYEDRQGNFWIGVNNSGLYLLDRNTGKFTRYYIDPLKKGILNTTPVPEKLFGSPYIISEDVNGALWIGTTNTGISRIDPVTKIAAHYGYIYDENNVPIVRDTANGFTGRSVSGGFSTRDGQFWVPTFEGELFKLDNKRTTIPFYPVSQSQSNSFYCEDNNNILWIGTANGLLRIDQTTQKQKLYANDPKNKNSLCFNNVTTIRVDENGHFWLATRNGLDKFDPVTEKFTHFRNDPANPANVPDNNFNYMIIGHDKNLWLTSDSGVSRMDRNTGLFTNYKKNKKDSNAISGYFFVCLAEDKDKFIWTASDEGIFRLDARTGKYKKYRSALVVKSLCIDSKGTLWAGGEKGLYYYDKVKDDFILFADQNSLVGIGGIINLIEDDLNNLWVHTSNYIVRISEDRTKLKKYTDANGVRYTNFFFNDNFKGKDGKLFFGEGGGYYAFYPDKLNDSSIAPDLVFSSFKLRDNEVLPSQDGIITSSIWEAEEIRLNHKQNVFSFDFFAIDFMTPGDEKYQYMLENYDDAWRDIGSDHRAFFFNVPPGKYVFRVKVTSGDGSSVEKSIRIIISPPWWRSWWAYIVYGFLGILSIYLIYRYQKSYIVRRERERAQQKELAQAKEIEKAYKELKTTQAQLIQSEKMASLGELTAGIAHEIQNPLNFVNNFSEVNSELIGEMKDELSKGNLDAAKTIADSISENEQKIIFHGKRADSIVKGMLQHSRSSSGVKEPTDINALADEYLRLAYHGLRAKDKTFNAVMKTDFDESIGKINIVPQDIGRVILNLITNAFYVVNEKKKMIGGNYEPVVLVSTKKMNGKIEIKVKDNGNGIPQKVMNKIFQPFFTTKPTGQGTGLGLSLSYDIVKAHGGELKVETKENIGSEFIMILPIN